MYNSKKSFKSNKENKFQKQKFNGATATKMPIPPKEVIDMKVGDITDTKNSVAEGDAPGGGTDSTEVVSPDTTNHILSFQVWRPWAD